MDPTGKFGYVANLLGGVSAYTINAATGALTEVAGSPFPAGNGPVSVTVEPGGKFAYVANSGSNDVSAYAINAATGALTAVAGSPFAVGNQPRSVTVHPTGKFAYVAIASGANLSAYSINAATGALTAVAGSPFAAGIGPSSVTVDPTGKFAYVANYASNDLSAYTVNAATGALTPVAGSLYAGLSSPASVVTTAPSASIGKAFSPATINAGAPTTLSFTINNPTLTAVTGAAFTDSLPCGLLVATPNGLAGSCGSGAITAAAGTGTVSLSGGSIPANSSCTFSVNLVSAAGSGGACQNTTSPLMTNQFGTGTSATATLIVHGAQPAIVSRFPAAGATGVTISEVDVTFDRAMNPATFNSSTFTLRAAGAASNVTASIYVSGAAVSLVPSAPLATATTYTVTIAGTVTDTNGIALGTPATWTFTTAASASPPVIVSRFPAAGATGVTASQVDVTFDRAMNGATFDSSSFTLRVDGAAPTVPGSIYVSGAAASLVFSAALMPSTTYRVFINGTVTDTKGVELGTSTTWTFTTAASSTPPAIVSRFPAAGAAGVTGSEVDVTFDREMNAATFNSSSFTLRAAGAGSNIAATIYVFGAAASLVPSAALAPATT